MPCKIGENESEIAELLRDVIGTFCRTCLVQLCCFFADLVDDLIGFGPVKTHPCRAFLQLHRTGKGRQANGDTVKGGGVLPALRALVRFHLFPISCLLVSGFVTAFITEDVRVAPDHLFGDRLCHIIKGKRAHFFGHLGVIDYLQQEVPQLVFQVIHVVACNGVGNLVCFFDCVGGDRFEILLDIPGASVLGIAQTAHDLQKPRQPAIFGKHDFIRTLRHGNVP